MSNNYYSKSGKIFVTKLQNKIDRLLDDIITIYPHKIIAYLRRDNPSMAVRVREIRKETNYIDNFEFFKDFGFQYIDINTLNLSLVENREEIEKAIKEINEKRDKEALEKKEFIEKMNIFLPSISDYYIDNNWVSPYITKIYTKTEQEKINKAFNKLISIYPNRIVYELEKYANHYIEDYIKPLKEIIGINNTHDIIKKYGFKIISSFDMNINNQLEPIDNYLVRDNWIIRSKKIYEYDMQPIINYIFDILYAIFPKRIVTNIDILNKINGYMNICERTCMELNYSTIDKFFSSFGFLIGINKINDEISLPDVIYSPNRKILYKVIRCEETIKVDKNTTIIKANAVENLNFKYLDLSELNNYSLVIEKNSFENCSDFTTIINPNAINKIEYESFNNCNNLNVNQAMNLLMKAYQLNCVYSIELKNDSNNKVTINTFNLLPLGTYVKNINNNCIYFINKITYASKENTIKIFDDNMYISYSDNTHKNKILFDYSDTIFKYDKDEYGKYYYNCAIYYTSYCSYENKIENKKTDKSIYKFENFVTPIFENETFIRYEPIPKDKIINDENFNIVDTLCIRRIASFKNAILNLNLNVPFTTYTDYIYTNEYINTFLKIHNANPLIFSNSYFLMKNEDFICKLFELYSYLDTNIIIDEHLSKQDVMIKILKYVKGENREKLQQRMGDLL